MDYKIKYSFRERFEESKRILNKYPNRIQIICEKIIRNKNNNLPSIDKIKYLVPHDLTFGQFIYVIRKKIKLKPDVAIFLFVNKIIPSNTTLI